MIFLESPILGEPKEAWTAWLAELRTMDQRDESVKFAIRNAEISIDAMEQAEAQYEACAA
ncbi:hypothetical protein [Massilia timonae]|uniref:hypothetical protein n=1 Tax=Massilia timonae TaxID=47229 RepID=UPI0008F5A4B5|nr:hypothetical protein [Massilia timonae]